MTQSNQETPLQNLRLEEAEKSIKEMELKIENLIRDNDIMYNSIKEITNAVNVISEEFNNMIEFALAAQEVLPEDYQESNLPSLPYFNKQSDDDVLN